MKISQLLPFLIMTTSLIGCQTAGHSLGNPEQPYPPQREPAIGDILHLPTGYYVTRQAMHQQALRAQVVYVGETHDNPASHRVQEEVLQALAENNPGGVTLAMEMFTPAQQAILDLWTAGELSEKEFLQQTGWYDNWGLDFAYYRPLLQYCKDHGIPVLGLNAEKDLKQKIARTPVAELDEEDRLRLPEMDHDDPYQRAMVRSVYSGHDMGQAMLDGFQRVQTLWDETMAESLANHLKQLDRNHQVLVVAGGNHIRYGFGIPRRVFRRTPASYLLIGSTELIIPDEKKDRLMDVAKPEYPMPPYHFLVFTEYESLPERGVKLGIMLDKADGGLLIKGVIPGSLAEQYGLEQNDVLVRIDEIELVQPFDLIYELQQKDIGDQAELTLLRAGEQLVKTVEFTADNQKSHGMK